MNFKSNSNHFSKTLKMFRLLILLSITVSIDCKNQTELTTSLELNTSSEESNTTRPEPTTNSAESNEWVLWLIIGILAIVVIVLIVSICIYCCMCGTNRKKGRNRKLKDWINKYDSCKKCK